MAELVDAHDSNSCSFGSEGSTPSFGTNGPGQSPGATLHVIDTNEAPKATTNYPFRHARLATRKGDLNKRWYVEFYVYDLAKGEMIRKMEYGKINLYATASGRRIQANKIITQINALLEQGYVVNSDLNEKVVKLQIREQIKKETYTFGQGLHYALSIKKGEVNDSSWREYRAALNVLSKYLKSRGTWSINIAQVNHQVVNSLFNYLKGEYISEKTGQPLTPTSINNYRTFFRTLINVLRRENILSFDPSEKVPRLRETTTLHDIYSDEDIARIKGHLVAHDPHLWLLCQFVYYCFVRPKREARALQVKHLRSDNRLIIPSDIAKTNLRYPVIPEPLQKTIKEWGLRDYPKDYYLFASGGKPGPKICTLNHWTNRYKKLKDTLELPTEQTLYSWKHTGVCRLYQVVKDPHKVMEQCGHTKLETTMKYLRQLGQFDNNEVAELFPRV